jgi:hypothetical protein
MLRTSPSRREQCGTTDAFIPASHVWPDGKRASLDGAGAASLASGGRGFAASLQGGGAGPRPGSPLGTCLSLFPVRAGSSGRSPGPRRVARHRPVPARMRTRLRPQWHLADTGRCFTGFRTHLERVKKYRSRSRSGLFAFWLRFGSVAGHRGHAPSPKPRQNAKILAPNGHGIS